MALNPVVLIVAQALLSLFAYPARALRLIRTCEYWFILGTIDAIGGLVEALISIWWLVGLMTLLAGACYWFSWMTRNDDDDDVRKKRKRIRSKLRVKLTSKRLAQENA